MWDVECGMWEVGCGMWDVGGGMWDVREIEHLKNKNFNLTRVELKTKKKNLIPQNAPTPPYNHLVNAQEQHNTNYLYQFNCFPNVCLYVWHKETIYGGRIRRNVMGWHGL